MTHTAQTRWITLSTALAAAVAGGVAIWYYASLDLTLSHYDAKAHLVVARRILDSLMPGWQQIGAVWLPLPHVLNALPVQVDAWYRHGTSGVALSLASFVGAAVALVWYVHRVTGAAWAAVAAAAVFLAQPDLLYLQATPMTEPLLLGLALTGSALLYRWTLSGGQTAAWVPGLTLALACLTRYEAWPMAAAALGVAGLVLWREHCSLWTAASRVARVAVWPLGAFAGFLVLSKATVGTWLVTGGFYVAENPAHRDPLLALTQVGSGLGRIAGWPATCLAAAGAAVVLWTGLRDRSRQAWWFALALAGCAALPFYAFVSGHPFRIRYMVPLVAAAGACVGLLVASLPRRVQWAAGLAVLLVLAVDRRPFGLDSPMVQEAQWDRDNQRQRRQVTACLVQAWHGEPILVSMGALAHYMQELSHAGFVIRHFVHEGIGNIWVESVETPARHARFLLVEERAEGGDLFAERLAAEPAYLDAFERTCDGGGVALYVRK